MDHRIRWRTSYYLRSPVESAFMVTGHWASSSWSQGMPRSRGSDSIVRCRNWRIWRSFHMFPHNRAINLELRSLEHWALPCADLPQPCSIQCRQRVAQTASICFASHACHRLPLLCDRHSQTKGQGRGRIFCSFFLGRLPKLLLLSPASLEIWEGTGRLEPWRSATQSRSTSSCDIDVISIQVILSIPCALLVFPSPLQADCVFFGVGHRGTVEALSELHRAQKLASVRGFTAYFDVLLSWSFLAAHWADWNGLKKNGKKYAKIHSWPWPFKHLESIQGAHIYAHSPNMDWPRSW